VTRREDGKQPLPDEVDPLADLFDERGQAADEEAAATLSEAVRRAKPFRRWAALGGALLVGVSLVPLPLNPFSSLVIGIVGISLVALGAALILVRSKVPTLLSSADEVAAVLAKALQLSRRVEDRASQGRPLTDAQRKDALSRIQQEIAAVLSRSHSHWMFAASMYVPDLPLPSGASERTRVTVHNLRYGRGVLRAIGVPWLALLFVVFWTSVFLIAWGIAPATCDIGAARCEGAFQGLSARPTPGDFIYFVANAVRGNMPPDIIARSRITHMAFIWDFCLWGGTHRQVRSRFLDGHSQPDCRSRCRTDHGSARDITRRQFAIPRVADVRGSGGRG